ncbi:glycosyltransferase family 2 protein [Blautia sp. MSJ-9]|jgi:glycosyltransferase involved in cell wall biosynthesis|uniref:glycosyltransferase family 2 protein n=1 Tax=Blautia sp. MSJ-9 TaxID=2841511 RepID=UPI001C10FF93|nr:glycosyltransferase [Blautia sp. MSJ-9]MBU5680983.1 glycosyltransferase [Blautia sp. MSJ-9]
MNDFPELSVIIPVYNVQSELRTCLDSVINQSYLNMEIIVINDASTDGSAHIIEEYAAKYQLIKPVFLQHNIGVGDVRNQGIALAKGRYVGFVDSDDWIDMDFYQNLVASIKSNDSDIAVCGVKTEYNNSLNYQLRYKYNSENCITGEYALKLLTKSENYGCFITPIVNNKVYNADFLKNTNIRFNSARSFQDDFFSFFAILRSKRISLVTDTYYHYYQRQSSTTHTFSKRLVTDCLDTLVQIRDILQKDMCLEKYKKEYYSYVERLITSLLDMLIRKEQDSVTQKEYLKYILLQFSNHFTVSEVIDYIDASRIFNFFDL